ncbi:extracellular electron transfer flavoprotein PplA [Lacticaseibacillus nasuensis]|nr:extracellular electron transfer flavoprotein PplA [Lacticaseibacillus nasuensis]
MKLAKTLSGVGIVALSALTLAACGNSSSKDSSSSKATSSSSKKATSAKQTAGAKLQDGTYNLEETGYSHGYRAKVGITVAGNKITKATYDYVDKAGKSKTKDAAYEKQMKKVTKTGPKEYIPALAKAFVAAQANTNGIEVVTGATESSQTFKNYAQQLVQAAQAGNTATIKVANTAKMQDGTYKLEEKNYSHGYRTVFSITVAGGKITESNYDNIDKSGKSKTKDAAYEKQMKKVNKVGPVEYTKALNKALVSKQNPAEIQVVSGATHSSDSFILYAEQLINAAQAGNTKTIMVDNVVTE